MLALGQRLTLDFQMVTAALEELEPLEMTALAILIFSYFTDEELTNLVANTIQRRALGESATLH